ncbi:Canalicular multispecific organic anion transporter 1, partial [Kickxella alabastrina]
LAFVSLTLFNMLHTEFFTKTPMGISDASDASTNDMLASARDGTFRFIPVYVQPTLSNIYIECKRSELVAVIGRADSGKSSLMSAILSENIIDLPGGQKARVSLGHAMYSRADIYILDDPLAAGYCLN